jgi:hypothetical protein
LMDVRDRNMLVWESRYWRIIHGLIFWTNRDSKNAVDGYFSGNYFKIRECLSGMK